MNSLRRFVDKIKPNFEKGGKFAALQSTFEAFETFLFVPNHVTQKGSHIRDAMDMKRTMIVVVLALVPAVLMGMWNAGYQNALAFGLERTVPGNFWFGFLKVFPIIVVSYVVGLGIEFMFAQIRRHEVSEGYLVSGILVPLVIPVDTPLWMVAVATVFAVIIGKEVFGGVGMNILNPALTARAFLFFAYPTFMSGDKVWIEGLIKGEGIVDGFSGATALGQAAVNEPQILNTTGEVMTGMDMFLGIIPGSIGETSMLAILIGAVFLIYTGVGSWKIILSVFAGGTIMGLILNAFGGNALMEIPFWQHLMLGGFAFGAVFMATDMVASPLTTRGVIVYGIIIGAMVVVIRLWGGLPEGVMYAILFANAFSPHIDGMFQPRVYGTTRRRKSA